MEDLISRQAAIDAARDWYEGLICGSFKGLEKRLRALPSAEPKTGKWIIATGMMPPEFHGHHCCSECGNFANMEPPFGNREDLSKFCPNCGAKMYREDSE